MEIFTANKHRSTFHTKTLGLPQDRFSISFSCFQNLDKTYECLQFLLLEHFHLFQHISRRFGLNDWLYLIISLQRKRIHASILKFTCVCVCKQILITCLDIHLQLHFPNILSLIWTSVRTERKSVFFKIRVLLKELGFFLTSQTNCTTF